MKLTRNQIIGLAILGVALVILFIWQPWKKKNGTTTATGTNGTGRFAPIMDANGNVIGISPFLINDSARARSCCSWGGGFVGSGCKYPITKDDKIPGCQLL